MGASESTSRSIGTKEEKDDPRQQENNGSGESSIDAATAVATAAAGVAFAAWGISKLLSNNSEIKETAGHHASVEQPARSLPYKLLEAASGAKQRSRWIPPARYQFKMNTDGACRPAQSARPSYDGVQRGPGGFGGILRDHKGNWVRGFRGFIGVTDCLTSEFHGILRGLELLDELKLKGSILENDCQAAFQWVVDRRNYRGKSGIIHACWPMIMRCRELVDKNGIICKPIHGDNANQCADKLANMGIDEHERDGSEYVEMEDVPYQLSYLVQKDAEFNG